MYARRLLDEILDRKIARLERSDTWNVDKDFARFQSESSMGFCTHLEYARGATGKLLSKSALRSTVTTFPEFVLWLLVQSGFRRRIKAADADDFNLSQREEADACAASSAKCRPS